MTVKRWVVRRKSDNLYSCSAHGWTPDITLAAFFQDEHLAHLAVDEIKDVIPVLVTLEEMHPYNQQAHRDQVEAMAKAAPPPGAGALRVAPYCPWCARDGREPRKVELQWVCEHCGFRGSIDDYANAEPLLTGAERAPDVLGLIERLRSEADSFWMTGVVPMLMREAADALTRPERGSEKRLCVCCDKGARENQFTCEEHAHREQDAINDTRAANKGR